MTTTDEMPAAEETAKQLPVNRDPISAFIIAFNEEDNIVDCLNSVKFCDEVLVVDSFSTDRTPELAAKWGARVVQRKWEGYRAQKVFGLSTVSHEWVINLDADERVSGELRDSILQVLRENKEYRERSGQERNTNGYYLNRVVFYLGRWWRRGGWYPEYRLRFFRRSKTRWGGVEPHEKAMVDGETARLAGELQHYTYRQMEDQFVQLQRFASIAAREEFAQGRRVGALELLLNPTVRFFKFYFLKQGYREGIAGLIVALAEGYYVFMKYAKIWELWFNQQQQAASPENKGE